MPNPPASGLLARRHGALWIFYATFLLLALTTRVALVLKAGPEVSWDATLLGAFALGLLFDLGAAALVSLPLVLLLSALPARAFERRAFRGAAWAALFACVYALMLGAVAEWLFWDEFGTRFNFIAVDYLVYTTEVLGNIRESYPLPSILLAIVPFAAGVLALLARAGWMRTWLSAEPETFARRLRAGTAWAIPPLVLAFFLTEDRLPHFQNNYNREIAKDGVWSLFAAYHRNVIDYGSFYRTIGDDEAFDRLREELEEDGSILLRPGERDTLRYVKNPGPEWHPNVIQITVESLSAQFLGVFDPQSTLTPNLDELARKSLLFESFYATGTRTDRGMEALSLSLPPTPGRSMIKRPRNEDLFTLGSVFRSRGYDTAFLYGGYGYFDNMNYYFGNNGYRVVDRNAVAAEDVTFANVWGACDEDLYRWTLREADQEAARGKPFHFFVMTTSNHRPYTFPAGRIDLPSKTAGRRGAVKYTDFAIGQFLREAATRPWYRGHGVRDRRGPLRVERGEDRAACRELPHPAPRLRAEREDRAGSDQGAHEPDGLRADAPRPPPLELPVALPRTRRPARRRERGPRARRQLPEARAPREREPRRARAPARGIDVQDRPGHRAADADPAGRVRRARDDRLLPGGELPVRARPLQGPVAGRDRARR
jgi:phosphoglycerol transferase MdoB-like AlkP superfamily enzyme